ncbi:cupin domain-containing protein, partial [Angustibacter aerolatus]
MTAAATPREGGHLPALPALQRLLAIDPADFAQRVWSREPLLSRADELPAPFTDLLDADAIDELSSARALRTPFVRMAKDGDTLPERSFTSGGGIGAGIGDQLSDDKVLQQLASGSTLVLQALHRTWPPIVRFAQQLAADLGHPVQANAYVTPPQNRGFDDHYDVHDVFVLQVEGEKRWRIHAPVLDAPLRDQPWTDRRAAVAAAAAEEPLLDVVLRPGDCLYLPRGTLHAATALGGVSAHVTLGVHVWTRHALAEQLVRAALHDLTADVDVRGSLRLGVAVDDAADTADDLAAVRDALLDAVVAVDAARVADGMA